MSLFQPGEGVRRGGPRDYFEAGITRGNDEIEIFVDGARVPSCIRANRLQGWAVTYQISDEGRVVHDGLGRPKQIYIRGYVEFRRCNH